MGKHKGLINDLVGAIYGKSMTEAMETLTKLTGNGLSAEQQAQNLAQKQGIKSR